MIAIIDYGMGNLHSVSKAVERLGFKATVTADPEEIMEADGAILPGVGAYGDAMQNLKDAGLEEVINKYVASGKPLLGICLGMQLLFDEGEEYGRHRGLGLLQGTVVRFQGEYKVPHMGWNKLSFAQNNSLLAGLEEGYVYFVHSFHVKPRYKEDLLASTNYYQQVTAIVGRGNIYGMQFHPEKSGELGMRLLANFLALTSHTLLETSS